MLFCEKVTSLWLKSMPPPCINRQRHRTKIINKKWPRYTISSALYLCLYWGCLCWGEMKKILLLFTFSSKIFIVHLELKSKPTTQMNLVYACDINDWTLYRSRCENLFKIPHILRKKTLCSQCQLSFHDVYQKKENLLHIQNMCFKKKLNEKRWCSDSFHGERSRILKFFL